MVFAGPVRFFNRHPGPWVKSHIGGKNIEVVISEFNPLETDVSYHSDKLPWKIIRRSSETHKLTTNLYRGTKS